MIDLSSFGVLLGGLGIGSLLTTILRNWSDNKRTINQRTFEEKRDAYINYLNIVATSQTMPEKEALWARTYAIERVKLCGSHEVIKLLEIVTDLPPGSSRRPIEELIQAMRNDLSF